MSARASESASASAKRRRLASVAWLVSLLVQGCGAAPPPAPAHASPPPAPKITPGELDPRTLLGDLPVRAARLGAGVPSMVTADEATEGDWRGAFVDVPKDACLLGYARVSSTIEDVDMAVYADDGTQLAVDEGRDVHPTVLLCPPHPDRVYVAAHVVDGEGFVVVAAQLVPQVRAAVVARALGARGTVEEGPRPADAWPGLDETVRSHRAALGGTWETFKKVALTVDARVPTFVSMPVDTDECVDAVIVPDDDVSLLDVEALDGDGRVVARAREGGGTRTLTLCSPVAMAGSLAVRPHSGRGLAAVVLARAHGEVARDLTAQPEIAWVAATQPLAAARHAHDTLLAKTGYGAPTMTATGQLVLGRRQTVPLDLKALAGACARIDVVAGAPLGLVFARVWDDTGALLAAEEASSSMTLFACATGPVRLELETRGRPGPFAVQVRAERWRDPAFAGHPLATSRMMARAATGPDRLLEGKQSPARAVTLDPAHGVAWTESIAAGKCARVTVGVEGEGAGVDLRAFDASDDSDLDRGESATSASVRACAGADAARSVRFEARASAGKVDAIVGEETTGKD
jgi:hypothetical protein